MHQLANVYATKNGCYLLFYSFIFSAACRGTLMDDAVILSCGHSFGSSGMQHVYKMVSSGSLYRCIYFHHNCLFVEKM